MKLDFDFRNVKVTEFGVGRDKGDALNFVAISVNADVKAALLEMAQATWSAMEAIEDGPVQYEPGENHGDVEYLFVQENNDLDDVIRTFHKSNNLPIDGNALSEPENISCYFARFVDGQNRRLTALRRASQFKGVLKKRLIQLVSDSLAIVEDKVFKLDSDFDLLIDSKYTLILRPSAFESLCDLKQKILNAVPTNVASIQRDLPFVDFKWVQNYASTHSRAARYLASIRTQNLAGITRAALVKQCRTTGVEIEEANDHIVIADSHVMGFLEVLDRRRYVDELDPQAPEPYRAARRQKIGPP